MKRLTFILCVLCATLISSCTLRDNVQETNFPVFKEEIGITSLKVHYVNADSIPDDLIEITTCNYGGNISTHYATLNDSILEITWEQVGTARVSISENSLHNSISFFVHPCTDNEIWIDIEAYNNGNEFITTKDNLHNFNRLYSRIRCKENLLLSLEILSQPSKDLAEQKIKVLYDSICSTLIDNSSDFQRNLRIELAKHEIFECFYLYNWYQTANNPDSLHLDIFNLNEIIKRLDFNDELMPFFYQSEVFALDLSDTTTQYGKNLTSLSQLCQLIQESNKSQWHSANENDADFINDDFCIAAYKYYYKQALQSRKRQQNGVFVEETPIVQNENLLNAILENHKGKKVIIDFWGTRCGPCMYDINQNEDKKDPSITYIYITCNKWSPYISWNSTINNIKGHHYYVSDEAFNFMLKQHDAIGIPFKLYFSEIGNNLPHNNVTR